MPTVPTELPDDPVQRLLLGDSPVMLQLRDTVRLVARANIPVLIVGPTGVGKELVARSIHASSGRSGDLVAVNVCAVSESLFESTLFGQVKGAFTGAQRDTPGYLGEAHGGTLFLDEIGSLSAAAQVKLLRAVETGVYRAVGALRDRQSDFRLISATNEPLRALSREQQFREDLYHRLAGFVIQVPALHERSEDAEVILHQLLVHLSRGRSRITDGARSVLRRHAWPGNVRELRNVAQRLVLTIADGEDVTASVVEAALQTGIEQRTPIPDTPGDHGRDELFHALSARDWDIDAAALALGVHRATIYRWMQRLGIKAPVPAARRPRIEDATSGGERSISAL